MRRSSEQPGTGSTRSRRMLGDHVAHRAGDHEVMLTRLVLDEGVVIVERERRLVAPWLGEAEVLVPADPSLTPECHCGEFTRRAFEHRLTTRNNGDVGEDDDHFRKLADWYVLGMHVDLFSVETQEDWYPTYQYLRDEQPVYRVPGTNDYVISRYDDIMHVLRHQKTFPPVPANADRRPLSRCTTGAGGNG